MFVLPMIQTEQPRENETLYVVVYLLLYLYNCYFYFFTSQKHLS